jgi:nickel/cobalt exporter
MRTLILVAVLASLLAGATFWALGGDRVLLAWAMEGQRAAQGGMGRALAALRTGDPSAVVPLLSVCFIYGFFHSVGPGHGKVLIGGYGAARAVGPWKLSAVALASSLAQGATAVLLVGVGVWVLNWSREAMTGLAERLLQPLGFAAIALIGVWLAYRGVREMSRRPASDAVPGGGGPIISRRTGGKSADVPSEKLEVFGAAGHDPGRDRNPDPDHAHDHDHDHGPSCGHAHAPSPGAVAGATSPRELLALIGAVAIRPCTGAIFLLVLTAQMGVFVWGVAGTLAMALGTASVTITVALAAVLLREGALAGLSARAGRVQPVLEIAVGLAIAWIGTGLAIATL